MRIKRVTLTNFRSYATPTTVDFSDLNCLIGKNDVGKSTVLEALDIFFNNGKGPVKYDATDRNANSPLPHTEIIVTFDSLPKKVVVDSQAYTTLADEYLLNKDGDLEIKKKYSTGSGAKTTSIICNHPDISDAPDLLNKTIAELKKIAKDKNVDLANLDKRYSSMIRRAVWRASEGELNLKETEIELKKGEGKELWPKIEKLLPTYSLFQSDRKNVDGDSEIQDPLKIAVSQKLSEPHIEDMLSKIANEMQQHLATVANSTVQKLSLFDTSISESIIPSLPDPGNLKWNDVFKNVAILGDEGISINKRGSGVRRLVLLSFFLAEVERKQKELEKQLEQGSKSTSLSVIYAIEEPETSQHSANQVILVKALKELSCMDGIQVVFTTHSALIVSQLDFDCIRLITNSEGSKIIERVEEKELLSPSLHEVNFLAFGEAAVEYHAELFGELQFLTNCNGPNALNLILGDLGTQASVDIPRKTRFDNRNLKGKSRTDYERDGGHLVDEFLPVCIRNLIDHPEAINSMTPTAIESVQKIDNKFSINELQLSIQILRKLIHHQKLTTRTT